MTDGPNIVEVPPRYGIRGTKPDEPERERALPVASVDRLKMLIGMSKCRRMRVGALLVNVGTNEIVGEGFNMPPPGVPSCTDCIRIANNVPRGSDYSSCPAVHAEQMALLDAGRAAMNAQLFYAAVDPALGHMIARPPCITCTKLLLAAGVYPLVVAVLPDGMAATYDLHQLVRGGGEATILRRPTVLDTGSVRT